MWPLSLLLILATVVDDDTDADGRAGRERVRLLYEAPPSCPPRDVVVATIAAELGYDPTVDEAADAAARAVSLRITAGEKGHHGVLLVGDAERAFTSESCASVVASAAVAAAIVIDPAVGFAGSLRKPIEAVPPTPPAAVDDEPGESVSEPPRASVDVQRNVETSVYVAPFLDVGVAPGLGGGGVAGAVVHAGVLSVGLEGRASVPRGVQVGDGAFVDVFVAGGAGLVCAGGSAGGSTGGSPGGSPGEGEALRFAACAEALLVDYVVTGRGLRDARTDHALLAALGPRLLIHWTPRAPLTLGGFVEVLGVPLGVRVRDAQGADLFASAPVAAAAGLSVGAVF